MMTMIYIRIRSLFSLSLGMGVAAQAVTPLRKNHAIDFKEECCFKRNKNLVTPLFRA